MNRAKLKTYAPQARRDFIQAMTDRAAFYGLTANKIEPVVERGDVAVIAGREHPRAVAKKRKQLEDRIKRHGFNQTMEALAYTWFNRLVAIRFMELHGYLEHGYRVLSHPEGKPTPEILEHAEHVQLPGLKKETVIDLKLAGNKEAELYRLLLTAQCNALNTAMPFLFEKIDDETELLLPDNLLHSDSLIRKLVSEIDEEDWQEVEIIGWIYQFYISEKKDEVIGKVVASEDIPAATQLFTPNWIVKYLVQNTLGRQWLATYPQSALRQQMEYYIEPAEQTPEVQEQLKAITPTSLNPEELTLLDPACGSAHILAEGYDLFKAIYQERGYRAKDIPALILQKNLFGLEIDDRAAQLAAFALMMKARADDRHIFDSEVKPHILAFQESKGMDAAEITHALNSPINKGETPPSEYLIEEIEEEKTPLFSKKVLAEKGHVLQGDIASMLELFENAKTFGSLIQIPPKLAAKLPEIEKRLDDVLTHGDLSHASAQVIKPLLQQARFLTRQYDAVVANPPYMNNKFFTASFKEFCKRYYKGFDSDIFSEFIVKAHSLAKTSGHVRIMCPFVWMFISSYEALRRRLIEDATLTTLVQLEYSGFAEATVPICAFTFATARVRAYRGAFIRLTSFKGPDVQGPKTIEAIRNRSCSWFHEAIPDEFECFPGKIIAYWASPKVRDIFRTSASLGDIASPCEGMTTGDTSRFIRRWHEVAITKVGFGARDSASAMKTRAKWFPYCKGGEFRKWYGNNEHVVNWQDDGLELRSFERSYPRNTDSFFLPALTWSKVSSAFFSIRMVGHGFCFDTGGLAAFPSPHWRCVVAGFLNSHVARGLLAMISPTLNFTVGGIGSLPLSESSIEPIRLRIDELVGKATEIATNDWASHETSWEFEELPLLTPLCRCDTLDLSLSSLDKSKVRCVELMKQIEIENNHLFITAYGLESEIAPEVDDRQITLDRPDREEDIKRLISYAVGCIMGRYSLDKPGLIYADCGNHGFDPSRYQTFPTDDDGIIPLLETDWGIRDDVTNRIVEFNGVAWPKENLEENLKFIADSLGSNNGEQPRDTIRHYLATGFYKHHLSMYKRRPIYWLFSSGKQRAFQCLVYLHRYHEGTLARMRTEYVIPLQGQIAARIEQLEGDKAKATSTSHRRTLQKKQDDLKKQQAELLIFEEKLKHAADQKISLDLDDGVKVNYAKFGDLLAEAKAITGGKDDE